MVQKVKELEENMKSIDRNLKLFVVFAAIMVVMMGFSIARIEIFGSKTKKIDKCLSDYIADGYRLEADEIIQWNIKEEMSAVEIYEEWENKQWNMSIANLKHVLISDIGRAILVDHFGETEILELELRIGIND